LDDQAVRVVPFVVSHGDQVRGAGHNNCVIWLTITFERQRTDASDKDMFDLGDPLTGVTVIEPLSAGDIGVSQDDESKLFSYGPFRPAEANKSN
jgi:hypothetical protein